jgi:hypothetical protein
MISRVQIQPLRGILISHLLPSHSALPQWLLDCPAAIVGSSDIVDNPNDIDVLVKVPDTTEFERAIDGASGWHYSTSDYLTGLFTSVKSTTSLPVNIIATDDTDFFEATLLAQEVMLGINEQNREAFRDRRHRVSLFDTIYQAYKTPDDHETPEDAECPF